MTLAAEPTRAAAQGTFNDLREFIAEIEAEGELRRLEGVSADLEMGAITEIYAAEEGPAVLFDRIPGHAAGFRLVSNLFATLTRTAKVLRLDPALDGVAMLGAWRQKLRAYQGVPPIEVPDGPVFTHRLTGAAADLSLFPAPLWHEDDGGRYIGTGCSTITIDPDTGVPNAGTYRCMVQGPRLLTVKLNKGKTGRINMEKWHARGEPCPIAVCLGEDPSLYVASVTPLPQGQSELDFAGWLRGRPVEVVKGPLTGLPIPATAEIVLEGEIPPPEQWPELAEGPFGEWPGYYADDSVGEVPVMNLRAVYYRDDPIVFGAPPMAPPAIYLLAIPFTTATLWDQLEKAGVPDVTGVWSYVGSGQAGLFTVIAIRQRYAGHAKQAGLVATGARGGAYGGKYVVIVDDDVDIANPRAVIWAIATRSNVRDSIELIRDVWTSPADPALTPKDRAERNYVSDRAIILATRPYQWRDQFPKVNSFPQPFKDEMRAKWQL
jgi:UbiD family decarboxylase